MKKTLTILAAAVAAFVSTSAMAEGYLGLGVGQGHLSADCGSCNANGFAAKVNGGWQIAHGFGVELGYTYFGEAKQSYGFTSYKMEGQALTLAGTYEYAFAPEWSAVAKLGLADFRSTGQFSGGGFDSSSTETKVAPYYALGAAYQLNPQVKLDAGIEWTQSKFEGSTTPVRAITVGLRFAL